MINGHPRGPSLEIALHLRDEGELEQPRSLGIGVGGSPVDRLGERDGLGVELDVAVADAALPKVLEVLLVEHQELEILDARRRAEATGLDHSLPPPKHLDASDRLDQRSVLGVDARDPDDKGLIVVRLRKHACDDRTGPHQRDLGGREPHPDQIGLQIA